MGNEYRPKCGDAPWLGSKRVDGRAGKTVRSIINTCQSQRFKDEYRMHYEALYKCTVYCLLKPKFNYAILVADRFEAGRRPAASWNMAYHLAH